MTLVPSLVTRRWQVQKTTLPLQACLSLETLSTETLFPTTPLHLIQVTAPLPSTPPQEHGRTRQMPTSTAQILLL